MLFFGFIVNVLKPYTVNLFSMTKSTTKLALKYRSYILTAGIILFFVALLVTAYQYLIQRKQEIAHIREIVIGRAYEVESLIKATKDRVTEIHHFTLEQFSKEKKLPLSPMMSDFKDRADGEYFSLFPKGYQTYYEQFGLIYGKGSFNNRDASFYSEINALIALLPMLKVTREITPHLPWIYYYSDKRISAVNPGSVIDDFLQAIGMGFTEFYNRAYMAEWWKQSLPETNPEGNSSWTKIYLDDAGKGLMITYAIPLRVNGEFRGVVAGDVTLDFLSNTLRRSEYSNGLFLIVSDHSEVLGSTGGERERINSLSDLLPGSLAKRDIDFHGKDELYHIREEGYNLFFLPLNQAPWYIVFILPESDIIWEMLPSFAIHHVILIILFTLLITGYIFIEKTYIKPAISLVEHIEHEAKDRPLKRPKVPGIWVEWFDQVSDTFNERRELNRGLEKRVEERTKELRTAKSKAEEASTAKSQFLAGMSHELRTPLNAILGFNQLMLRDSDVCETHRDNLEIINRSGEHLLSLINDILDMSKIEAGRMTLEPVNFDLLSTLDSVEEMFRAQTEKKGLEFTILRDGELPQYICTDERKLRQTLINLLSNALKFTNKGGIVLHVLLDKERDNTISFGVEDTGPGIPSPELEMIFEPFVQTSTGQKNKEGTGLGLSISRQFVQLMRGDLKVLSKEGKGSIFEFTIVFDLPDMEQIERQKTAQRVVGISSDQREYRILIVEDNEMNRTLLHRLLDTVGFKTHTAGNGIEAIEQFNTWRPHLIWMDMQMPIMDGYEATRRIKASPKGSETPIIALTASVFEEDKDEVFSAGCDDFLRKPFKEMEIFNLLSKYLGVRYTYEEIGVEEYDNIRESESEIVRLNVEALSALPGDVLVELNENVQEINLEGVGKAIDRIGEIDETLKKELLKLLKEFRFDTLQLLLKKIDDDSI